MPIHLIGLSSALLFNPHAFAFAGCPGVVGQKQTSFLQKTGKKQNILNKKTEKIEYFEQKKTTTEKQYSRAAKNNEPSAVALQQPPQG